MSKQLYSVVLVINGKPRKGAGTVMTGSYDDCLEVMAALNEAMLDEPESFFQTLRCSW